MLSGHHQLARWAIAALVLGASGCRCGYEFAGQMQCRTDRDCLAGSSCAAGLCLPCPACGDDQICLQAICFPRFCGEQPCPQGQGCGTQGVCADSACVDVTCPVGQVCAQGTCYPVDCPEGPCARNSICYDESCRPTSCVDVTCPAGEACAGGTCHPIDCAGTACAEGAVCPQGACEPVSCVELSCPAGTLCANGTCYPTRCEAGAECAAGQACVDGTCRDAACVGMSCAAGTRCSEGACLACKASETTCGDGVDEDCDAATDCADLDCLGRACAPDEGCASHACDSQGTCAASPLGAGAECRPSAGLCDTREACDGTSLACPADTFLSPATECRPRTGPCDSAELCTGDGPDCPADVPVACAPAVLSVSGGPAFDFGAVMLGGSAAQVFTITNTGGYPATLGALSTAALGLGGAFTWTGGDCAAAQRLAPSASCALEITFAPIAAGTAGDTLELQYEDGLVTQTASRPLTGLGTSPALLTLSSAPAHDFGTRAVGSSAAATLTVTNAGDVGATLGDVSDAGLGLAAPFSLSGGTCSTGGAVPPGASCTLLVTYAPAVPGPASDSIDLTYDDGTAARTTSRTVTGAAAAPAALSISDGPAYDFGTQPAGTSTPKTFTLSNTGSVSAVLGAVETAALGLAAPFALTGGTCATGLAVPAAGSCTLVVSFVPTARGPSSDSIDLAYDDGAAPQLATRAVTGTGASPAVVTISDGPAYDWGAQAVGSMTPKTFTVSNSGGFAATLGTVSTAGLRLAAPFALTGGTCTSFASLAPGGSCTLTVTFAPTAPGSATDSIDLSYQDGAANQTATRAVSGTGAGRAVLTLSDGPAFDFGTQAIGSSTPKTFTVSSSGGVDAILLTVSTAGLGLAAPWSLTGGTCATGSPLTAGASCTLVVTFSPTAAGPVSDSVDLRYDDGAATQTASRAVSGTGAGPAVLSISEGPTYDFGTQATGSNTPQFFTVSNSGGTGAVLGVVTSAGLGLAPPYVLMGGSCATGATVAPAGSCTLVVAYTPTATGVSTDSIDLSYQDGVGSQTASRALRGTGAAPALLTISDGPTFSYGTRAVGSSTPKTFTVSNSGGVGAALGSVTTAGLGLGAPYALTGGTCAGSATVAAASDCTLIVSYAPTATGATSDSIDLTYDDGAASRAASRAITGTAVSAALLTISDGPTWDFGIWGTGASTQKAFTVTNSGGFDATLGTVSTAGLLLAAPYSLTGGTCASGGAVAPAGSCTLAITFAPGSVASFSDSIELGYQNGASAQTASRAITGLGTTATKLAFSVQPTGAQSGVAIAPSVVVEVRDGSNFVVQGATNAVTLAIQANPSAGTLSGTTTQDAIDGRATFAGLSIDKAGDGYTLRATSGALTSIDSAPFNVTPGPATALGFAGAPGTVATGACSSAFTVVTWDAAGNLAPVSAPTSVTLTEGGAGNGQFFASAGCSGAPTGSVTIAAASSQAQFYFKHDTAEGVGITASAPGLTPISLLVTVTAGGGSWATNGSTAGAPSPRSAHSAVWTGTEMIVWGGYDPVPGVAWTNDGYRYDPAADTWTGQTSMVGVPPERNSHGATWTGTEMLVWGGWNGGYMNDGGRYNPSTDTWGPALATFRAPSAREFFGIVYTGTEMLVWGGMAQTGRRNDGGRYNPATDTWAQANAFTTTGAPSARNKLCAVWTGTEMLVWGGGDAAGYLNTGGRYDPAANKWGTPISTVGAPSARQEHTCVWTGTEMIVWGGQTLSGTATDGGRYNPATDTWGTPPTLVGVPGPRYQHSAVYTGTTVLFFGGAYSGTTFNDTLRYLP